MTVIIVDSIGANIASIQFAFERLGVATELSHDSEKICAASHVILPGVGAAATAMQRLNTHQLIPILRSLTQPVLGICLGMQLLFDQSEEGGEINCLGIMPGKIKKLFAPGLTIPHMGWNTIEITNNNLLLRNIPNQSYAYFVHSYAAPVTEQTCAATTYGAIFTSIVHRDNFYGTQFHPERSGEMGKMILKNFLEL